LERLRLEEEEKKRLEAERLERLRLEEEERKRQEEQRLRSQVNYTLSIIACNNLLKGMMVTHNVLGWTSSDARKNLSKLPVLAAESDDMEMLKIIAEELLSAGMQVRLEGVNGLGEVQNIQLTTSKTTKAETKDASIYYDVVLVDAGCAKLQLIKVVREACGLGLKEAKEMIDGTPSTLKEGMSKAEADALKRTLEEAGAEVDLRQAK
jgi:large subunit ribosomal protein L7/L12